MYKKKLGEEHSIMLKKTLMQGEELKKLLKLDQSKN
jgi:hypothetical protein